MTKIFISYRRTDTQYPATLIYKTLLQHFGEGSVFKDIDNIPLGANFKDYIKKNIEKCEIVLLLMGSKWLTTQDERGNRRIDNPTDLVRLEIESAMERNILLIPLLLEEIDMPKSEELPESIRSLSSRQGMPVRSGPDFDIDMARLINFLSSQMSFYHSNAMMPQQSTDYGMSETSEKEITTQGEDQYLAEETEILYGEEGVIVNAEELLVDDVVKQKVLCPLCNTHVFQEWPYGWDSHAINTCEGLKEEQAEERKMEYKTRLQYLFRPNFAIYALRTTGTQNDKWVQPQIYEDLKKGKARFGWSYKKDGNLRILSQMELTSQTEHQREIWEKTKFLLEIKKEDFVIYINLPEEDMYSVARVVGEYDCDEGINLDSEKVFDYTDENRDFRHLLRVKFIGSYSRRDENMPKKLMKKLKLRGRQWQIKERLEFYKLLQYIYHARKSL